MLGGANFRLVVVSAVIGGWLWRSPETVHSMPQVLGIATVLVWGPDLVKALSKGFSALSSLKRLSESVERLAELEDRVKALTDESEAKAGRHAKSTNGKRPTPIKKKAIAKSPRSQG